jgi:hypothetical protein
MQYRIWGEMIVGGFYSSKSECLSTCMFSRAGGKEPLKKKADVSEALGEVAKHVAISCILRSYSIPSTRSSSGNIASRAKTIDTRSKCCKQLSELKSAGVLTEEEYQSEEAIMATLKKL